MADDPNALITAVYNQARLQGDSDTLAYQKAVAALTASAGMAGDFGQSFGYYTDLNQVAANAPPRGTPTLQAGQLTGSVGYIPGFTGSNASQTMANLSQQASTAQGAAGLTGFYVAPKQSAYTPGTFVRIDPNTYDTSMYGDLQMDVVLPSGQLQRINADQARAMGWNGDVGQMSGNRMIPFSTAATLEAGPPTQLPQQTLESLTTYGNLNNAAMNRAVAESGVTGYYTAPQTVAPPGTNAGGGKFSDLDQQTQMAYFYSNGGDWQAAMNKWVADSNNAIRQAVEGAGGTWNPNAPGGDASGAPGQQMTTAYQEQLYTQWLRAQQQADLEWQQQQTAAQNYLNLLSGLRGPADWAQYQKVLGATPQGTRDLVAAAAGQYIPGGGATTGTQPQAANLNTLYNQATGQQAPSGQQDLQTMQNTLVAPNQMAPQTWNALQPSQQQMLLGVWESQGYSKDDAANLFKQSLPKYATTTPTVGAFRLQ